MNEEEILKKHFDKENIFQSVKKAMQEFSNQQNQSLTDQIASLKKIIDTQDDLLSTRYEGSAVKKLTDQLSEAKKDIERLQEETTNQAFYIDDLKEKTCNLQSQLEEKDKEIQASKDMAVKALNFVNENDYTYDKGTKKLVIGYEIYDSVSDLLNSEEFKNYLNK